jgi:hypothetical protein
VLINDISYLSHQRSGGVNAASSACAPILCVISVISVGPEKMSSSAVVGGRRAALLLKANTCCGPTPCSTIVPFLSFACLLIGSSSRSTDSRVWLNLTSATHPIDHAREPKDKINDEPRHPSQLVVIRARLPRPVFFIANVSEIVIGRHRGRFLRSDFV